MINVERASEAERTGYGKLGLQLERALDRLGAHDPDSSLRLIIAPPYALRRKRHDEEVWCFCMFESSRLPESFLEAIDSYAGLIVPNAWNLQQFSEEHPNVHLAPLGVDTDTWNYSPREVTDEFRVLFLGRSARKGEDLVQPIFDAAFPDKNLDPKPVLIRDKVGGRYSEEELVSLVRSAHVVLGPSRGEGWNLMPFEALATGCPVVLSDIPGHPYSHLPGAYTGRAKQIESWLGGAGHWWAGYWWDPDVEDLGYQLRSIYNNYPRALSDALIGAETIASEYTWDHTAKAVLEAVGPRKRPPMSALPEGDEPLAFRRWTVNVIKPVENANIGDNVLNLPLGQAHLTADQLRVLITAGYVEATGKENFMRTWEQVWA